MADTETTPKKKKVSKKTGTGAKKTSKKKKAPAADSNALVAYDPEAAFPANENDTKENTTPKKKKKKPTPAAAATTTKPVPIEENAPRSTKNSGKSKTKLSKFNDEEPTDENDSRRRIFFIAAAVCCCILLIAILGLVLGLTLGNKDDNDDGSASNSANGGSGVTDENGNPIASPVSIPTQAPVPLPPSVIAELPTPTEAPVDAPPTEAPAPTPTRAPVPTPAPIPQPTSELEPTANLFVLFPTADSTVYLDGFDSVKFSSYGDDETFVVQNGAPEVNEVPDAVGLILFNLDDIDSSIPLGTVQSYSLRLYHKPHTRRTQTYPIRVRRLPFTNLRVDNLSVQTFNPPDDVGIPGAIVNVGPSDTILEWDITDLVNINEGDLGAGDRDPMQIFLMMEAVGPDQERGTQGDEFFTIETRDPPQLLVRY